MDERHNETWSPGFDASAAATGLYDTKLTLFANVMDVPEPGTGLPPASCSLVPTWLTVVLTHCPTLRGSAERADNGIASVASRMWLASFMGVLLLGADGAKVM